MAVKKMQYQNLNHALKLFKVQVLEGIPYAQKDCPEFNSAEDIFNWLKLRTKYKNDPQGTELFQTLPTLLENNFHGITGHGDCDCFTIAALTILAANNFKNFGIVLVGRNSFNPVHIYCYVIDEKGNKTYIDLTNKYYNQTRNYLYKQEIPFNLTLKEKNDMLLQLADMGAPRKRRARPSPEQIAKYKQSAVYKRQRAAYLKRQAEVKARHEQHVRQGRKMRPNFNHVYLPSKGVQIREDYFDDRLSNGEFQHMLLSEGYELNEIEELAGRRGDRRRAKKDEKRALKKEKKLSKVELRRARAEKKKAAGEAKKTRAQAKQDKANRGGGGEDGDESEAESTAGRIFGKVIGGAKQAIGVYKSARGGGDDSGDDSGEESTGAGSMPTVRTGKDESAPKMITIFGKEIKQSTAIIGTVVAVAATAGIVIAVKNKNKRAAQAA